MKRLILFMVAGVILSACAQSGGADLSWTFQWGNQCYGLLFEDDGLTPDIKAAIRDDVQGVLSYNPMTNATFNVLSPKDSQYGAYDGRMTLSNAMLPSGFPLSLYKTVGGINYFDVDINDGSNYMAKVALTNQQNMAISGLSNFLFSAQNMTTGNTTVSEFQQKWWHPLKESVYVPREPDTDSVMRYIAMFGGLYYAYPSILSFETVSDSGKSWFGCKIWTWKKTGAPDALEMDIVYGGGEWRFVPFVDD